MVCYPPPRVEQEVELQLCSFRPGEPEELGVDKVLIQTRTKNLIHAIVEYVCRDVRIDWYICDRSH